MEGTQVADLRRYEGANALLVLREQKSFRA